MILKNYRDTIESVLLQTLEGINQGKTADELAETLALSNHLRELPYLQKSYGTVAWSVRRIFSGYVGWFDGNPTHLHPLTASEYAEKMVSSGSAERILEELEQAIQVEEYQ